MFQEEEIRQLLKGAIQKIAPNLKEKDFECDVSYPSEPSHGDYASGVALKLAKSLGKPPRKIAEEIMAAMAKPAWVSKIEIAGAGFINFFLSAEFLTQLLVRIGSEKESFGRSGFANGATVVTDTSHPNIAKPMAVHHLLSTIIGSALNNIFAAAGYKVIRDNYLGDWGTQFGKLIYAYRTWGSEEVVKQNPIPELLKLYVKFHEEAEKDAHLEDLGRAEFKKLENGDKENRRLWQWIVDLSLQEFQRMYDRLGVSYDYIHGESFYEDKMQVIIDMGIKKGTFIQGERGALIAPLKDPKMPPCIIKKSDGATLYATRDLARTKYWEETWHPDIMMMCTDSAQILHFQQFFEVAEKLGITDAKNVHVVFGRMKFPEKRMSTRKGNVILMEELLDEAEERAQKIVEEKNPELSAERKRAIAHAVGIGSVKYAVLAQNRLTDIEFTWEKMLSLDGNSAPYVQYAHARARAILRKAKQETGRGTGTGAQLNLLKEPQELAVTRLLPKFPEIVSYAAQEFKPNLIANYLYDLASRFNSFYAALPVLQAEPAVREMRLALTLAVAAALKNGLALLGIEAPEEM